MNPATDIGKQDLPVGIRNRFTEIFVNDMTDPNDLLLLVSEYLQSFTLTSEQLSKVVSLYGALRECAERELVDIAGRKPHYNLRTFCRALNFAVEVNCGTFLRSLYEGFCFSFTSQLDRASHSTVIQLVGRYLNHSGQILEQPIPRPQPHNDYVNVEGYWLKKGYQGAKVRTDYVLTTTVKANLREVARAVCVRKYPVLLQGPTSVGKTSLIHFLADISGYQCIRINNHEHTDIQEYLGCYVADQQGKLQFQEGPLICAMRGGYWVILDELNLAPTDVLEALNRLLDQNRELFITETQEVVKAESGFMLFATQNPPGQYGGRKLLSQAFRNRFVELHFDEFPNNELEIILYKRCSLPKSYCSKLVSTMKDLQTYRRGSGVFAGKYGFITLRDLFRWAQRYKMAVVNEQFYDWEQHLAEDGYMLLAGRVRNTVEEGVICQTISKHFKRTLSPDILFGVCSQLSDINGISPLSAPILWSVREMGSRAFDHLVLTKSIRRILVLAGRASLFKEPVLLVGETGCGKTTVCQLFAAKNNQHLFTVNCHMHTEAADFLGSLRPVRKHSVDADCNVRLFEWKHGPLVLSMIEGGSLLIDEISLADDSVLERLNSVLEPERRLLLAERTDYGVDSETVDIKAHPDFLMFATMNPGGDFGKKELSAALRNRFTEIWCPGKDDPADLLAIIEHNLKLSQSDYNIGERMLDFVEYWSSIVTGNRPISVRDILSWVEFINVCTSSYLCCIQSEVAYVHGACLVFVDGIGTFSGLYQSSECTIVRQKALEFLFQQVSSSAVSLLSSPYLMTREPSKRETRGDLTIDESKFGIYPFFIKQGQHGNLFDQTYSFNAPTTCQNVFRLLRALQLSKPILLEGSPGVGKTSLVLALAAVSGHHAVRINLSEQTDIGDLFGTDLPTEGGKPGEFSWRDGPLLSALKAGDWIILDELNLASQSVLEGLNACLDHRSEVYVPELGMTFSIQHEKTRIFGCQNPAFQGGNRKSLPKSFLNRFTLVFLEEMNEEDFLLILQGTFHGIDKSVLLQMIKYNMQIHDDVVKKQEWGAKGGPWEFNLRDLVRWCQLMLKHQQPGYWKPSEFVEIIYQTKFRTKEDRLRVIELTTQMFGDWPSCLRSGPYITSLSIKVGRIELLRTGQYMNTREQYRLLHHWLQPMSALVQSLDMGWMTILVGNSGVGKSSLVRAVAQLTGHHLLEFPIITDMDTTDLLGGFEQADWKRDLLLTLCRLKLVVQGVLQDVLVLVKLDSCGFGDMDKFVSLISGLVSARSALTSLSNS
jgi:midasin